MLAARLNRLPIWHRSIRVWGADYRACSLDRLLYLTLYLQDVLGYSALNTGLRLLVISGGILLTSTLAGRLTAVVPIVIARPMFDWPNRR